LAWDPVAGGPLTCCIACAFAGLIDPLVAKANITQAPPIAIDAELDLHCITAPISKLSKIDPGKAARSRATRLRR